MTAGSGADSTARPPRRRYDAESSGGDSAGDSRRDSGGDGDGADGDRDGTARRGPHRRTRESAPTCSNRVTPAGPPATTPSQTTPSQTTPTISAGPNRDLQRNGWPLPTRVTHPRTRSRPPLTHPHHPGQPPLIGPPGIAGQCTRQGRRPHLSVIIDIDTLAGHDDLPAHLTGYGAIPAGIARSIAASAATITALTVNPDTGTTTNAGALTYRPRQELRDQITALLATCQFPSCRQPSWRCDIDHQQPFDHQHPDQGGPTTTDNTAPLCRRHHLFKHHSEWQVHLNPADFTVTWDQPHRAPVHRTPATNQHPEDLGHHPRHPHRRTPRQHHGHRRPQRTHRQHPPPTRRARSRRRRPAPAPPTQPTSNRIPTRPRATEHHH